MVPELHFECLSDLEVILSNKPVMCLRIDITPEICMWQRSTAFATTSQQKQPDGITETQQVGGGFAKGIEVVAEHTVNFQVCTTLAKH